MIRTGGRDRGTLVDLGALAIQVMYVAMVEPWDTVTWSAYRMRIMTVLWHSRCITGSKSSTQRFEVEVFLMNVVLI